jgi:cbb3-type cytochrome oxidase subunit 3
MKKSALKIILFIPGFLFLLIFMLAVIYLAYNTFKSKKDKAEEEKINALLKNAKEYYNCKYYYTFKYPESWTISDETHYSDKVFVYGNDISFSFSAAATSDFPSLDAYLNQRMAEIGGKVDSKELTKREDFNGTLVALSDPEAILLVWPQNEYFMEMYGSGKNYANNNPEAYLVGTNLLIKQTLPQCSQQVSEPVTVPVETAPLQAAPAPITVDPETCQHPNGDVEYWWDAASEAERECFRVRYPDAPFLKR